MAMTDAQIYEANRRDCEPQEIAEGVTCRQVHGGQKRYKGDSIYEYEVESELPPEEVEKVCREHVRECDLPMEQWRREAKSSMDNHFREYYRFESQGGGRYVYSVIFPSTH